MAARTTPAAAVPRRSSDAPLATPARTPWAPHGPLNRGSFSLLLTSAPPSRPAVVLPFSSARNPCPLLLVFGRSTVLPASGLCDLPRPFVSAPRRPGGAPLSLYPSLCRLVLSAHSCVPSTLDGCHAVSTLRDCREDRLLGWAPFGNYDVAVCLYENELFCTLWSMKILLMSATIFYVTRCFQTTRKFHSYDQVFPGLLHTQGERNGSARSVQ